MSTSRAILRAVPVGLLTVALSAPTALGFQPTKVVDVGQPGNQVTVTDLAGRGKLLAITSHRTGELPAPSGIVLSRSADGGTTWESDPLFDPDFQEPQVTVCAGNAVIIHTDEFDAGFRDVVTYAVAFADGAPSFARRTALLQTSGPDIACLRNRRLAMAWFQQAASGYTVRVQARDLAGPGTSPQSFNLGKGAPVRGLSIAASKDRLYVAWFQGKKFKVRRFAIGPAPDSRLTSLGTSVIATLQYGRDPQIGGDANRVFLAFMDRGDLRVRRSTNKGVAFGAARTLRNMPFPADIGAFPTTVMVRGKRAVIGGAEFGGLEELRGKGLGYLTTNGGNTWTLRHTHPSGRTAAGLVKVGGNQRFAEAWDQSITQPATQRVRFHRE